MTTTQQTARGLDRIPAPTMVLGSIASVQIGNAWADTLFDRVGAGGAALLRLVWALVLLMVIYRPSLRRPLRQWIPAALLGLTLAGMNVTFYHAIARIPMGIAVAVEFVGPLGVAIAHSRKPRDVAWVGLAAGGIVLLAHGDAHHLSYLGLALAAIAGGFWGLYILLQGALGRVFSDGSGLALAMLVAMLAALPDGIVQGGGHLLHPSVLAIGLAVGLLSSVIPYSIELKVLRRIAPGVFGVLMSLEPAAAAIAGMIILSQGLSLREWIGIALVSAASLGTAIFDAPAAPEPHPATPTAP